MGLLDELLPPSRADNGLDDEELPPCSRLNISGASDTLLVCGSKLLLLLLAATELLLTAGEAATVLDTGAGAGGDIMPSWLGLR